MMLRRQLTALLLALLLVIPGLAGAETRTQTNETTGFTALIQDDAGLLDAAEYDSVLGTMMPVTEHCNAGFYTCDGSTEYVVNKAKAWGNRVFSGDYTMFIIDMATRQLAVYSSERIFQTVTQSKAYSITDNVYSYASRKDYSGCAQSAFNQISKILGGQKIAEPMRYASNALLAVLAALLLAYMLISTRMEQEIKVSLPMVITATVGAGAAIVGKRLVRKVKHESHSGHGGGGFGGGGGGGFGGGGGGGSHGF